MLSKSRSKEPPPITTLLLEAMLLVVSQKIRVLDIIFFSSLIGATMQDSGKRE